MTMTNLDLQEEVNKLRILQKEGLSAVRNTHATEEADPIENLKESFNKSKSRESNISKSKIQGIIDNFEEAIKIEKELSTSQIKIQRLENQSSQSTNQVNYKPVSNGEWSNGGSKFKLDSVAENSLQDELNNAKSEIFSLSAEKALLEEKLEQIGNIKTGNTTELESKISVLEEMNSQLEKKIANAKEIASQDSSSFAAIHDELNGAKSQISSLSAEKELLEEKLAQTGKINIRNTDELKLKISTLEEKNSQLEETINSAKEAAVQSKDSASLVAISLQDELNGAKSQISSLSAEKALLEEKLVQTGSTNIRNTTELESKISSLEEKNSLLEKEIAIVKEDANQKKDSVSFAAIAERGRILDDLAKRNIELMKSTRRIKELENKVDTMTSEVKESAELKAKKEMLEDDNTRKETVEDTRKLREELNKCAIELEKEKADSLEVKRWLSEIILKNQQAAREVLNHREKRAIAESRSLELEQEVEELKAKVNELQKYSKNFEAMKSTSKQNGTNVGKDGNSKVKSRNKKGVKKNESDMINRGINQGGKSMNISIENGLNNVKQKQYQRNATLVFVPLITLFIILLAIFNFDSKADAEF